MVKSASCLELVFTEAWTVRTLEPPLYRIDRILIPFDGLYATDTSSAAAVIFLGNGTYFSGPLGNSSGLPLRAKLHKSLAPYLLKRID